MVFFVGLGAFLVSVLRSAHFKKFAGRAPERWERWKRVPSQFEILAATFG